MRILTFQTSWLMTYDWLLTNRRIERFDTGEIWMRWLAEIWMNDRKSGNLKHELCWKNHEAASELTLTSQTIMFMAFSFVDTIDQLLTRSALERFERTDWRWRSKICKSETRTLLNKLICLLAINYDISNKLADAWLPLMMVCNISSTLN